MLTGEKLYNRFNCDKEPGKYHTIITSASGDKSKTPKKCSLTLSIVILPFTVPGSERLFFMLAELDSSLHIDTLKKDSKE